jgi:FkbM family methyltransferase
MTTFYAQFIEPGNLCFDIGANLGNRTSIFLQLGATVVAVEPQEHCMQQLMKKYASTGRVFFVQKALDFQEGTGTLFISPASTLSSMSSDWIKQVKTSGRFQNCDWKEAVSIPTTTLDTLIAEFGKPVFCKIDTEGFECQIVRGLTQPINVLSMEFTPEFVESTCCCIDHLCTLGYIEFNYSLFESMQWELTHWVSGDEMQHIMKTLPDKTIYGDVYARFVD